MRAPAPVGQGAAASEAGNALCFLCSRKNPGPLGNTMPHVEKKRGGGGRERKEKAKEINASRLGSRPWDGFNSPILGLLSFTHRFILGHLLVNK